MPRYKLRRDPCDCLDCREPLGPAVPTTAAAAVARQEPPPKSFLICLSNALQSAGSLQDAELPHLDALVAGGWAGLLACRSDGPPLLHQLLGLQQAGAPPPAGLLGDRFKQLRAVLLTDSAAAAQAGKLAGCYAVHVLGAESDGSRAVGGSPGTSPSSSGSGSRASAWPEPSQVADRIRRLLGIQLLAESIGRPAAEGAAAPATDPALAAVLAAAGAAEQQAAAATSVHNAAAAGEEEEVEGDDVIDMLILALEAANAPQQPTALDGGSSSGGGGALPGRSGGSDGGGEGGVSALEWADGLLRQLNQVPGFRETVLTSLVVGPGSQPLLRQPLSQDQPLIWPAGGTAGAQQGFRQGGTPAVPQAAPVATAAGPAAAAATAQLGAAAAAAAAATAAATAAAATAAAATAAADQVPAAAPPADFPPVRRPPQSYQFAGLQRVAVDGCRPALVVHRLPGVIRVDAAAALDLQEILQHGAAGCILAERLLPEVAYKLGRAAKYGA